MAEVPTVLGFAAFGFAARCFQLGIQKRPIFAGQSGVGGSCCRRRRARVLLPLLLQLHAASHRSVRQTTTTTAVPLSCPDPSPAHTRRSPGAHCHLDHLRRHRLLRLPPRAEAVSWREAAGVMAPVCCTAWPAAAPTTPSRTQPQATPLTHTPQTRPPRREEEGAQGEAGTRERRRRCRCCMSARTCRTGGRRAWPMACSIVSAARAGR
ncbi:hypothetical protein VHUM_03727 [Vanrija humicola]|uniref:Uncharacterized protein n=1 Tax=Vanrija humicola TaxID=5417 RepID=A0A7D8Z1D7_VANHU|nr:hypothetical protein VHUM_03727 [Vanrija humicola]